MIIKSVICIRLNIFKLIEKFKWIIFYLWKKLFIFLFGNFKERGYNVLFILYLMDKKFYLKDLIF